MCAQWTSVLRLRERSSTVRRRGPDLAEKRSSGHRKLWPQAQAKLQSEEQSLVEGEVRLAAIIAESEGLREEIPPTLPATTFVQELAELRACVSQLRQENSDLRCELQSGGRGGEERDRKQARSQSHSTLDLAPLNQTGQTCQSQPILNTGRADASTRMETLIETADASLRSNRFKHIGMLIGVLTNRVPRRDGMKGVRAGEASNPGPDDQLYPADDSMEVLSALEFDLTQLDSDVVVDLNVRALIVS